MELKRRLYSAARTRALSGSSHTHSANRVWSASCFSRAASVSTGFSARLPSPMSSVTWTMRCSRDTLNRCGAGARGVPQSEVAATPWARALTSQIDPPPCSTITELSARTSRRNRAWVSASIHAAPMRASISSTPNGVGITASSAVTLAR